MARTKGSQESFTQFANLIGQADGLPITASAGLGVDSGLPDFRGKKGFWRAYPSWRVHDYTSKTSPVLMRSERNHGLPRAFMQDASLEHQRQCREKT